MKKLIVYNKWRWSRFVRSENKKTIVGSIDNLAQFVSSIFNVDLR
jgi:hypothetical protein